MQPLNSDGLTNKGDLLKKVTDKGNLIGTSPKTFWKLLLPGEKGGSPLPQQPDSYLPTEGLIPAMMKSSELQPKPFSRGASLVKNLTQEY